MLQTAGRRLLLVCVLSLAGLSWPALSDTGLGGPYVEEIQRLSAQLEGLEARNDLDEAVREETADRYRRSIAALRAAATDQQKTAQLRQTAVLAPQEMARLQKDLMQVEQPRSPGSLDHLTLDELSVQADRLGDEYAELQTSLLELRGQLARMAVRPQELRQALTELREQLRQMDPSAVLRVDPDLARSASEVLVQAQRRALTAEIEHKEQELAGMDSREQLLEARRALAEAQAANINEALDQIRTALARKRNASALQILTDSQIRLSQLEDAPLHLQEAAQRNRELAQELVDITVQVQNLSEEQLAGRERVGQLERRYSLVQRQLGIGRGSVALSAVLRDQQRELAQAERRFDQGADAQDRPDVSAIALLRFQLQQDEENLSHTMASAVRDAPAGPDDTLYALLEEQRHIVRRLIDAQGRYTDLVRNVEGLSTQYRDTLEAFDSLLQRRRFWLPSAHPIGWGWWQRVGSGLQWMLQGRHGQQMASVTGQGLRMYPQWVALTLVVVAGLLWRRRWLRERLQALAEPVGNVRLDSIGATLGATAITILLALPGILLLLLLGFLLHQAPEGADFAAAAATAVFGLMLLIVFVEPFTNLCRPFGVAECHFKWAESACGKLSHHLHRLLLLMALPVFVISLTEAYGDDALRESLGRASFMLAQLVMGVFSWHVLHPRKGALAIAISGENENPWQPGYFWLPVVSVLLISLATLTWLGQYYTALELQSRFFFSVAVLGLGVVVYHLIVRWLTVAERRLAFESALRKRAEILKAREAEGVTAEPLPDDAEGLDLLQVSEQTRGLIKLGATVAVGLALWRIWSGTLPALQALDNIALWQQTVSGPDGKAIVSNITLGSLLFAMIVGIGTVTASRNLPGFLEITVLRRFSMGPGSRYAVATLFQYAIVLLGLLAVVNLIGLDASSVRWLIAALGVGLGFGLQEIFANFVSGLILLFERPVRVGDTVTVGDILGTVTRIRIRATTITDWDKREVIIPNRSFVTETVTNWTLSDDIARLILRFHVAPEADGQKVQQLMEEVVADEPLVLAQPESSAYMVGYDDRGCIYELRVYYRDINNWLPLQHTLYQRIQQVFREHDIRVAFPQRNVRVQTASSSVQTMQVPAAEAAEGDDMAGQLLNKL